jgi:hypothetical protein
MSRDRDQAIRMLSEALPQLRDERDRLHGEWQPDSPPITVLMGALGRVLGESLDSLDDDAVERIAGVIESLLLTGTEDVKNGVATGLLESVVASSETAPGATRLLTRLGPEARNYCRAWDVFTGRKTPGL